MWSIDDFVSRRNQSYWTKCWFEESFWRRLQIVLPSSSRQIRYRSRQVCFANSFLLHNLSGVRHYEVPKRAVKLEQVFEAMEKNKERLFITNWALTNTTLEEVFLHITLGHKVQTNDKELITEGDFESNPKKRRGTKSQQGRRRRFIRRRA